MLATDLGGAPIRMRLNVEFPDSPLDTVLLGHDKYLNLEELPAA